MSDFVGKEATVRFEVTEFVSYTGEVVADDERGITLRRPYRKGVRLELIPRDQITNVFVNEVKGKKRSSAAAPKADKPEATGDDFDDEDGFEDEPDLDFE